MSKIKLEVGKTYRNREGEEVEIVKKANRGEYPFFGSNGEWYTESGRFDVDIPEPDLDLIEEVPSETTRYTFAIPEGATKLTVEQVSNRIVVEMVLEKGPKPGDVMINEQGNVYVFKAVVDSNTHEHCSWLGRSRDLANMGTCQAGRPATPEEAQPLWDALKKAGKRWNPESMQMEEVPKPGDVYINDFGSVYILKSHSYNGRSYECFAWLGENGTLLTGGRCAPGRPATVEEAQLLFDALKKEGKRWNAETMQVEDMPEIDRIREWVKANLESGLYTRVGVVEAIEGYLKYKEGEQ